MPFRFAVSVAGAVVALSPLGCHALGDATRLSTVPSVVTRALEACNPLASRDAGPGDSGRAPAPRATSAWSGYTRSFPMFSLFIPDNARIVAIDSAIGGVSLAWPGCPRCEFSVRIQPDSGIGVEARIARMVAAQRTIDSINRDPHTVVYEFNDIDGPPQPFTTITGRGYQIHNDCGDCADIDLLFGRPGYIAQVGLGGDDDVPNLSRHLCEMTVIGKTFAWRE